MNGRILVAAPTYDGCGYALKSWADAYRAFTYPDKGALFVDNSDNLHYAHICRAEGIPTIVQKRRFSFLWDTMEEAWRTIVEYAHDEGYDLIASIEADVICPSNTLNILYHEFLEAGPQALVSHRYHPRGIDTPAPPPEGMTLDREKLAKYAEECWFDTLGCVLFPTELMWKTRNEWSTIFEVELYKQQEEQGYKRIRLKDRLDLVHLEDPDKHVKHLYGEGLVDPAANAGAPGRAHPADLSVSHPDDPPKTGWHGRKDGREGFGIAPKVIQKPADVYGQQIDPFPGDVKVNHPGDPVAAQKARDDLKWATLTAAQPVEWTCARCGKCCTEFEMYAPADCETFLRMRGFPVEMVDGRCKVVMEGACEHLANNDDGTTGCLIYEHRPAKCVGYKCGKRGGP